MIVFIALRERKVPVQLKIKTFETLVIHKNIMFVDEDGVTYGNKWAVTHTASGYSAYTFDKKWKAELFKEKVSNLNWEPIDVTKRFSRKMLDYIVKIKDIIFSFRIKKDSLSFNEWPTL
jgi:hypothetical protein